ncbi:MAG: class I tRNA ligase family protein, partial [bacterium]
MQNTNFKDFPKNYDYKSAEKRIAEYWESNNIYKFKDTSIDKGKDSLNEDIKEITGERQNAPTEVSSFCDSNSDSYSLNTGTPVFSIDTPPPYVSSAHLHVGHAMSYSQAEFIIRYKRMKGFNIFYPMGFDDNGLPTERYVEKKYKINKSKITRDEFIDLCLKETKIGINTYKELWQALGISVDWDLTYSTIDGKCRKTSQ